MRRVPLKLLLDFVPDARGWVCHHKENSPHEIDHLEFPVASQSRSPRQPYRDVEAPYTTQCCTVLGCVPKSCGQPGKAGCPTGQNSLVLTTAVPSDIALCVESALLGPRYVQSGSRRNLAKQFGESWTLKENGSGVESPKPWYLNEKMVAGVRLN